MERVLIACGLLRDELELAMSNRGIDLPVHWMEGGLHEQPSKLHKAVQEEIDRCQDADLILLSYGFCGGSMEGIVSPGTRLVLPRFHDCIQLLGTLSKGAHWMPECGCLYLTSTMMDSERATDRQYEQVVQRYGAEQAHWIYQTMYSGYHACSLMDTGTHPVECLMPRAQTIADLLELPLKTGPASVRVLEKLLAEEWDEEFLVLEPGQPVPSMGELFLELGPKPCTV